MKKGKYQKDKAVSLNLKPVALVLAMVLMFGGVVGGTVAWLYARTENVVNTFTYGDIEIDLEESDTNLDGDNDPNTNDYKMIPGEKLTKDPKVTVLEDSEACWLFVKLEQSDNFDDFMEYEVADGWTALTGQEGVYFRQVEAVAEDTEYQVLKGDKVAVKEEVTKDMLNALDADPSNPTYPQLTITAYAVQYSGFEPEITEGADEPTDAQILDAAAGAWEVVTEAYETP